MNTEDKEKCIKKIYAQAIALREDLRVLEEEGISMWQEIKTYLYGRNSG